MKKPIYLIILFFASVLMIACTKQDDIYKQYVVPGGYKYPQSVESLRVTPGYYEAVLSWTKPKDPSTEKAIIYWDSKADSLIVDLKNPPILDKDTIRVTIQNLQEKSYTFQVYTFDSKGNSSVPGDITTSVIGDVYVSSLGDRTVTSYEKSGSNAVIFWGDKNKNLAGCEVRYTSTTGVKTIFVPANQNTTTIEDYDFVALKPFEYRSCFHLDNVSDAIYSKWQMGGVFLELLDKSKFATHFVAGDNTTTKDGVRSLERIWDGSTVHPNILHTAEFASTAGPQTFTFDLGVNANIFRFHMWPRTDVTAFTTHDPRIYEVWASPDLKKADNDKEYWASDEWKNDWTKIVDASENQAMSVWGNGWEYEIDGTIGSFRYIRIVVKANWSGEFFVMMGEVSFWGIAQ